MTRSDVLGVVLTGGRSSRMGRDKAALPHPDSGTFADHAVTRLLAVCRHVVIAGAAPTSRSTTAGRATVIPDPAAHLGPVTGIVEALRACRAAGAVAALVTPVDMPHLAAAELRSLLAAADDLLSAPDRVPATHPPQPTVATFDGVHRQPLVAVYPVELLDALEQLAASSDRSLNRWLHRQPHRLHQLSPAAAANINTPDEFRAWLQETHARNIAPFSKEQPDR